MKCQDHFITYFNLVTCHFLLYSYSHRHASRWNQVEKWACRLCAVEISLLTIALWSHPLLICSKTTFLFYAILHVMVSNANIFGSFVCALDFSTSIAAVLSTFISFGWFWVILSFIIMLRSQLIWYTVVLSLMYSAAQVLMTTALIRRDVQDIRHIPIYTRFYAVYFLVSLNPLKSASVWACSVTRPIW